MSDENLSFVFVGGCPRSGTTLVKRMLDAHPEIFCGPEFGHLPHLTDRYRVMQRGIDQERICTYVDREKLKTIYRELIQSFFRDLVRENGVSIVAEKTPDNLLAFSMLYELFPQARFIEVIRNPLDVVSSYKKVGRRKAVKEAEKRNENGKARREAATPFNSPIEAARRWARAIHYRNNLPDILGNADFDARLLQIHYEELVLDPEATARRMADHIGVAYSPDMLVSDKEGKGDPKGFGGEFYVAAEYFRGINKSRLDVWKRELTHREVEQVVNEVRTEMEQLGYLTDKGAPMEFDVDIGEDLDEVAIVMASYNGADYLREQVESIRNQDFCNWKLLIRDDGSSDGTLEQLEELAAEDLRIELVRDEHGPQGSAQANFTRLAQLALERNYRYLFFADQDDIWEPAKLRALLERIRQVEADHPGALVMVHSDLVVVDEANNKLADSFLAYQGIRHEEVSALNVLLAQNFVTGCASMVNRALLKVALPFPQSVIMHDWWLAQVAAAAGQLVFVNKKLVRYRQHGENSVGAKGYWSTLNPLKQNLSERWRAGVGGFTATLEQARALHVRLGGLDTNNRQIASAMGLVEAYATLLDHPPLKRLGLLGKLRIRRQVRLMNLAFRLRVFLSRR